MLDLYDYSDRIKTDICTQGPHHTKDVNMVPVVSLVNSQHSQIKTGSFSK